MRKLLLITGIPASGKTTLGDYLEKNCSFIHLDAESNGELMKCLRPLHKDSLSRLIKSRLKESNNIVITWGFVPGGDDLAIKYLQELGFRLFWFDGDRQAARKAFNERATVPESLLDIQMDRIMKMNLTFFEPIKIIKTIDEKGEFLFTETVAKLLMEN